MSSRDPRALSGTVLDGAYRVEELLGQSDIALAFRGTIVESGAPITVHVHPVPSALDVRTLAAVVARLRVDAEAQKMLAMVTPGIAMVHGVGTVPPPFGSYPYRITEALDGGNLGDFVRARAGQQMPLMDAIGLLSPVLEGLVAAHERGVSHGGITPFGVFFTMNERLPKLVDFGVARALLRATTAARLPLGLPVFPAEYGVAEHFEETRGALGTTTDVAGAALLILALARGRPPREGDPGAVREQALRMAPTPRTLGISVPESTEALFARSLALSQAVRPEGIGAFLRELRTPSIAPPAGPQRTAKGTFILPIAVMSAPAIVESPSQSGRIGPHGTLDLGSQSEAVLAQIGGSGIDVFGRTMQPGPDQTGGASPLSSTVRPWEAEQAKQAALLARPASTPPPAFGSNAPFAPRAPFGVTPQPFSPGRPLAPFAAPTTEAPPKKSYLWLIILLVAVGLSALLVGGYFVVRWLRLSSTRRCAAPSFCSSPPRFSSRCPARRRSPATTLATKTRRAASMLVRINFATKRRSASRAKSRAPKSVRAARANAAAAVATREAAAPPAARAVRLH